LTKVVAIREIRERWLTIEDVNTSPMITTHTAAEESCRKVDKCVRKKGRAFREHVLSECNAGRVSELEFQVSLGKVEVLVHREEIREERERWMIERARIAHVDKKGHQRGDLIRRFSDTYIYKGSVDGLQVV
jgi:hypothetical protein